ncbi:ABC transporter ATP-binding protein [Janibacter corallicola]|uniref:ABC transporter ATP-binding protein n=1 Tax=Janibacter corallicola TaxID=415212 RepID=UPI0008351421|nr:ATP-binding cassette domain-containing protein [Janibacter corallicola]
MDTAPQSITVGGLTRRFGEVVAVDGVDFTVPAGQMTGFVGGNGAGKTTTMRMIMGVLGITEGRVLWGERPITTADQRAIGYMPEERGLYPKQKIAEQLIYLGQLKGMSRSHSREAVMELLERLGLHERTGDPVEKLSLGNQQRVQIAAALMTDPAALILDEPFSGLDPDAVDSMADLLREQTARGVPVLFSSHQLDLVDRLCDRLVILAGGRVRAQGTPAELRGGSPRRHRLVATRDAGWVREVAGLDVVDVDGPVAVLDLAAASEPERLETLERLLGEGLRRGGVTELSPVVPALSEVYREVTA